MRQRFHNKYAFHEEDRDNLRVTIFHEKFSDFQARAHARNRVNERDLTHAFTLERSTHDLSRLPDEKKIFVSVPLTSTDP